MSNSGPNAPGGESPETLKPKKNNKSASSGLLKAAIDREIGNPVNPKKFDAFRYKNDSIISGIHGHIDDLRRYNDENEDWSEISDEEIAKIKNDTLIRENVLKNCQGLVLERKGITDRIRARYPNIIKQPNWLSQITGAISGYNESELHTMSLHAHQIRSLVKTTFSDFQDDDIERSFEKVFSDIETIGTQEDIALVKKLHRDHERHGTIPSKENISHLLSLYAGATKQRKKEVLGAIGATLSIRFALENNIISEQYLEGFARTNFGELYEKLSPEQKKAFKNNLKTKKDLTVSIDELEDADTDKVFEKSVLDNISEEIRRDLSINKKELNIPKGGVMEKIKEELEEKGITDWEPYEEFLKYINRNLRTNDKSKCLIENIEKLKNGSILTFGEGEDIKYIRISKIVDPSGIEDDVYVEGLPVISGRIVGSQPKMLAYDDFYTLLQRGGAGKVLSEEEFQAKLTTDSSQAGVDGQLFDARHLEGQEATSQNIKEKIDAIDPEGAKFGFEEGTFFIAPATEENGDTSDEIWKIDKIHGDYIDLMDSNGQSINKNLPINAVYKVLEGSPGFKRIGKISSEEDFIKGLEGYGLPHDTKLESGKLIHEHDDGHGHKTKEQLVTFSGKEGHVRIGDISGGLVYFSEGKDSANKDEIQDYAKKHGKKAASKRYYEKSQRMTYQAFLEYLKKNKLEKAEGDYFEETHGHDDHHNEHSHLEGSFWSRIGKMQNFSSIWKGFEMITHSIEHTLEKGSKLDAAKFALSTSKFLHLPDTIEAQLYADIVDGSKEIVEKYQKKIQNLPGPKQRMKCIHIAHNKDARPEEVMAAIGFMVSSYGHLYAEDNKHYQSIVTRKGLETKIDGAYSFLDAFIRSTKMPPRDGKSALVYWRLKAYDKARQEAGTEGEPTEEQLLHALFKNIDGKPEEFPYAASVVKAIGGPGGFEKMWKFEGFDNAHKKGKDQTTMVNAQGRLNKAIGYLDTHEIYKGMGSMEQVAAKVKSPEYQAFPFVWAVGGFTKYASSQAIQKLKNYAENGFSFHAYAFLRKEEDNNTYKEVVRLALQELEKQKGSEFAGALKKFDSICSKFDYTGEEREEKPAAEMMRFWQDYQGKGLHDMLQNTNGWLTKMSKENKTVLKYRDTLAGAHNMMLKDKGIPGTDFGKDWYDEHGYESVIMRTDEKTGLKSLDSMLTKIRFEGTNRGGRVMDADHKEKIWHYVKNYMNGGLRDEKMFLGDTELQKAQYLLHRKEIINHFAGVLNAREVTDPAIINRLINSEEYVWMNDLKEMGINPMALFNADVAKDSAEGDYIAWKARTSRTSPRAAVTNVVQEILGGSSGKLSEKSVGSADPEWHDTDDDKSGYRGQPKPILKQDKNEGEN